jgi:hypothetical protein
LFGDYWGSIPLFKIPKEKILLIAAVTHVWLARFLLFIKTIKSGMLPLLVGLGGVGDDF